MSLLEPHNLPFAAALALMAMLAVAQLLGAGDLVGDADADFDAAADAVADGVGGDSLSAGGFVDGLTSLIGLGRVPFLIWFAMLLFLFAAVGVSVQALAENLLGSPLHPGLAGVAAGLLALPFNGVLSRPVGAIIPRDQTTAISVEHLVGRDATIQIGTARSGSPARGKVIDMFGQPHFVMVEPHDPGAEIHEGEIVLLVRRDGETFYAMHYESPLLGPE